MIPTWRCILTFDFYKKQLMRSDILCAIRYVRNLSDILSFISLEIFSAVYLTWLSVSDGLSSSLLEATLLPPSSWQPANPGARSLATSSPAPSMPAAGVLVTARQLPGSCTPATILPTDMLMTSRPRLVRHECSILSDIYPTFFRAARRAGKVGRGRGGREEVVPKGSGG